MTLAAGNFTKANSLNSSEDFSASYWIDPTPAKKPLSDDQHVEVIVPKDRCKAGIVKFGRWKCSVLGRGTSFTSKPDGSVSLWTSPEKTYYKQGTRSDGQTCYYISQWNTSGATPVAEYTFWLDGKRAGPDGIPAGDASYGLENIGCLEPVGGSSAIYGRTELRVHSGRNELANLEDRYTHGCVRIHQNCQIIFNNWLRDPDRRAVDNTLDKVVSGCGTAERSLKFIVSEVTDPADLENE